MIAIGNACACAFRQAAHLFDGEQVGIIMQAQIHGRFLAFEMGAQDSLLVLKRDFQTVEAFVFFVFHARKQEGNFKFDCFFHIVILLNNV